MNTNGHGLVGEDQTREIIGCAMEVMNVLGHGFLEKVYENALCVEMRLRGISSMPNSNGNGLCCDDYPCPSVFIRG
ncbi:MAG TPA: GxxExxY protein [Kiritimatiellia bacterium]|nr:GxxExxY protein [Kiritimatiellia bacterium]